MKYRNLDGSGLTFEQDTRLSFDEASHRYKVDDEIELQSVTQLISHFFKPFDAMFWSLKKCRGNEQEAEKMREQWDMKGVIASRAGTFMHKQIENYLDTHQSPSLVCPIEYHGKYHQESLQISIQTEWQYFLSFDTETSYHPFRTEWGIFDMEAGLAGTIDLLCKCNDGTYEMYDWKRSNKVDAAERNHRAHGLNGLEHLTDTSYVHYCLQQNLYRYMLEKNYGIKVSRMNLVVLHPDYQNYRIVSVPRMDKEVRIILSRL